MRKEVLPIGKARLLKPGYSTVTELPGNKASKEQLARLCHRYHFAYTFCRDKNVLEVGCGAGMGLGYLARVAKKVIGCDIDENILKYAFDTYKDRRNVCLRQADAHRLPFDDNAFDILVLYEAIYYLTEPERFVNEARRVLTENGVLIVCTVNKDWPDFNPSPYSFEYFPAPELHRLLSIAFPCVRLYGAFPASTGSAKDMILSLMKRSAVALNLMPKTMKRKEYLKRIFFGRLMPLPREIEDGIAEYDAPKPICCRFPDRQYKVLYALAYANGQAGMITQTIPSPPLAQRMKSF